MPTWHDLRNRRGRTVGTSLLNSPREDLLQMTNADVACYSASEPRRSPDLEGVASIPQVLL